MKRIVAMIISACVMVNSSMVALAVTNDSTVNVDKLYAEAYETVEECQKVGDQQSINQAREAIKKLMGVVDWAVGEFSKQIDVKQNEILSFIVSSISKNQQNPSQDEINNARWIIGELPDLNWINAYSAALDKAQDILIQRAVSNDKAEALSAIRELIYAENVDVKNFAIKLLEDKGWALSECDTLHVNQIIDHDDELYNYYGLFNDEYLLELSDANLQYVYDILMKEVSATGTNTFLVEDSSSNETINLYLKAVLPSNSHHKSILLVVGSDNELVDDHQYKILKDKDMENFAKFTDNCQFKQKICNGYTIVDEGSLSADNILKNIRRYVNRNEKLNPYSIEDRIYFEDHIGEYLETLTNNGILSCSYIHENNIYPYIVYDINDDNGSEYGYKAFKNINTIEDLKKLVNEIDKETAYLQGEYDKLYRTIPDNLVFNDIENFDDVFYAMLGNEFIDSGRYRYGFYSNETYDTETDIGYIYDESTKSFEFRQGNIAVQYKACFLIWKHGITIHSTTDHKPLKYVTLNISAK